MNKNLFRITACLAALALCTPLTTFAAKKSASPTPSPAATAATSPTAKTKPTPAASVSPAVKMERSIPFHGVIASVDARAKTFTIAGKEKSRVFKITDKTVVSKAGMTATMKDVVANEEVRGSYWKRTDGTLETRSVKLGPLTDKEKASKDAAKMKRDEKKESASPSPSPKASP